MIDFAEYIRNFRRVYSKPRNFETLELIKLYLEDEDMQVFELYSATVFPQYIKIGTKNALFWDNAYFDFSAYPFSSAQDFLGASATVRSKSKKMQSCRWRRLKRQQNSSR